VGRRAAPARGQLDVERADAGPEAVASTGAGTPRLGGHQIRGSPDQLRVPGSLHRSKHPRRFAENVGDVLLGRGVSRYGKFLFRLAVGSG
jgi:hypothetical protein